MYKICTIHSQAVSHAFAIILRRRRISRVKGFPRDISDGIRDLNISTPYRMKFVHIRLVVGILEVHKNRKTECLPIPSYQSMGRPYRADLGAAIRSRVQNLSQGQIRV
jgi:hypothetical protein